MVRQKNRLGVFERAVLETLRAADGPLTVNDVHVGLGNEGKPKNGALATTLGRLETAAFVGSEWGDAQAVRGGRRRRLYTISKLGLDALNGTMGQTVQTKPVIKVYVARMTEAVKGFSYYVTIKNTKGQETTPYQTRILDQALMERDEWAAFFGIPATPYVNENGEIIEASMVMHNFGDDDEEA